VQLQPIEGTIVRGTAYSIGLGTHAENAKFLAYGLPITDLKASNAAAFEGALDELLKNAGDGSGLAFLLPQDNSPTRERLRVMLTCELSENDASVRQVEPERSALACDSPTRPAAGRSLHAPSLRVRRVHDAPPRASRRAIPRG